LFAPARGLRRVSQGESPLGGFPRLPRRLAQCGAFDRRIISVLFVWHETAPFRRTS
jgi:hypothetical protein